MAIIVANRSDLTTPSLKEAKFVYNSTWPLYSLSDLLKNNNDVSDIEATNIIPANAPEKNRPGVSADEFIEKTSVIFNFDDEDNDELYYFPLNSDKRGTSQNPLVKFNEFIDKTIPGNNSVYDVFSDETLTNALGACSTDSNVTNLITGDFNKTANCTVETAPGFNIVMDQNAKKVSFTGSDTVKLTYNYGVSGDHCFSGYFRFLDPVVETEDNPIINDRTTYIKFGFEDSAGETIADVKALTDLRSVQVDGETYYEITQDWCEIAVTARLEGSCNLVIEWPNSVNGVGRITGSSLKIAGLRLDSGIFPYPFDFRHLKAHDERKQFPLLLDISQIKEGFNLTDNEWTIIYGRYLRYPHNSEFTYYDCIGNIYLGLAKVKDGDQEAWSQVIYQPRYSITNEDGQKEIIGRTRTQKMTYDPSLSWGYNIIEKKKSTSSDPNLSDYTITFTMLDLNSCNTIEGDSREITINDNIATDSNLTTNFLRDGNYTIALGISPPIADDDTDVLEFLVPIDLKPGQPLLLDEKQGDHPTVPGSYDPDAYVSVVDELDDLYGKPDTTPTIGTPEYWTYMWRDLIWPEPSYRGISGTVYSARYRDLYFFPRLLSDKEKNDLRNVIFELSNKEGYRSDAVTDVSLRSSNFSERSEINIRNKERIG